jgi:hypothetical protein
VAKVRRRIWGSGKIKYFFFKLLKYKDLIDFDLAACPQILEGKWVTAKLLGNKHLADCIVASAAPT